MVIYKSHKVKMILLLLGAVTVLTGCKDGDAIFSDINDPEADFLRAGEHGLVPISMSMNISSNRRTDNGTRMSNTVTQIESPSLRTVTDFHVIPYSVKREITASDQPLVGQENDLPQVGGTTYYYYGAAHNVPKGTSSFLCYCKATSAGDEKTNGSIVAPDLDTRMATSEIVFAPDIIYETTTAHADANTIANKLTAIALAGNWNTSTIPSWKTLFSMFTNEGKIIAGSSNNVIALVGALKDGVNKQNDGTLKTAVLAAIDDFEDNVPANFPAKIGLPDGAAVLQWDNSTHQFNVVTQASTMAKIISTDRYVYPPELYFYANSQIHTTNKEILASYYQCKTWAEVLDGYEQKNGTVNGNTRSAVIIEPLGFAVGSLLATVQAESGILRDADGQAIILTSETFPLKGILISGQYKQGFNFEPIDDINEKVIYDASISDVSLIQTASPQKFTTLTYQSKESEEPLWIALEFENNSSTTFRGVNGLIYPGTKFYLTGSLDPAMSNDASADLKKRVFTKSHITQITMKVASLEKAYNVVPDLLSGRLEIGVQLVSEWIEATPANVILK